MSSIRTFAALSVLAVGAGWVSMAGAGAAGAAPGISYDNGSGAVGIGDQKPGSGASAKADPGNSALAISVFQPAYAEASWTGTGNTAVAIDGIAGTGGGNNNRAFAIGGLASAGNGNGNQAIAIRGAAYAYGDRNNVLAVASDVKADGVTDQTVAAVCGSAVVPASNPAVKISKINCLP